ncbi:MAG TPA: hypothetical protein VHF26_13940 [Trebonia sp.]|nr:hypothetical protein [Trebonia sp.]
MYVEECLARDRHQEYLRHAEQGRIGHQVIALRKLVKRQERAERELLDAWRRVDQLRSAIGAVG